MYNHRDERASIQEVQTYLSKIEHNNDRTPAFTIDGFYSEALRQSIISFQAKNNLPLSGIADEATWNQIYAQYLDILRKEQTFDFIVDGALPLSYGDTGHGVRMLQSLLMDLSKFYAFGKPVLTGIYGLDTADAVRGLQRSYGLYESGEVDAALLGRIARDFEAKTTPLSKTSYKF